MIPLNPLEHQNAVKTLYSKCVGQICRKYGVTRMELDIRNGLVMMLLLLTSIMPYFIIYLKR